MHFVCLWIYFHFVIRVTTPMDIITEVMTHTMGFIMTHITVVFMIRFVEKMKF